MKNILTNIAEHLNKTKFAGLLIGLLTFIIIAPISLTDTFNSLELKLYDIRFKIKPSIAEWDKLYFVDIDDYSTANIGQFPWTRENYAYTVYILTQINLKQIAFDIIFPDKSPNQLNNDLYNQLIMNYQQTGEMDLETLYGVVTNHDNVFAESLQSNTNNIIAYTFFQDELSEEKLSEQNSESFQPYEKTFAEKSSIAIPEDKLPLFEKMTTRKLYGIDYPIPELIQSATHFGFVNKFTDIDGTIRKVKLAVVFDGRLYFNLGLIMLVHGLDATLDDVEVIPGKEIKITNIEHPIEKNKNEIRIPIDDEGMIYLNWAGPGPREKSFESIPIFSVMQYPSNLENLFTYLDENTSAELGSIIENIYAVIEEISVSDNKPEKLKLNKELNALIADQNKILKDYMELLISQKSIVDKSQIEDLDNAISLIDTVVKTGELNNKIGIIGLTTTSSHDISSIPIHNEYPEVGTYLNTINTIVQNKFIKKPKNSITFIIFLIIALLSGFFVQRLSARKSLIAGISIFALINIVIILLFSFSNIWLNQLGINLAFILPSAAIIATKLVTEESQKKYIRNAFSQYLSPDIIKEIIQDPEQLELGGESTIITTFFSDVAGFSTISEKLTATQLVDLLNEYLSAMTDIIISHGGTVDKYEGDAIMAFYGAPVSYPDHEIRACIAAIEMNEKLIEMRKTWKAQGKNPLYVRMGMNSGEAVVGNMGSEMKKNYTAMGDSVNLASRLEGANKFYSTELMISQHTYEGAKDAIEARKLDTIRVVGKTEPTVIYEILGRKGELNKKMTECVKKYNEGLEFFEKRQWKKAVKSFQEGLKFVKNDGPSLTYIERCEQFMKKPPSKKWDGVYSLKSK